MNLPEAMLNVLRMKGQGLILEFWKEDLAGLLRALLSDGTRTLKDGHVLFRKTSFSSLPGTFLNSSSEILHVAKILPGRIRKGLGEFQKDMLRELEAKNEPRDKAIFCLQVLGILTSSTVSTFSNLRAPGEMKLGSLRLRSALAKFVVAELILRSIRLFLRRFLAELEKDLTSPEDLEHVRYFFRLMEGHGGPATSPAPEDEAAFRVTERLRNIILYGDDEI